MAWSLQTRIGVGFGVAIAMLAAVGLISVLTTRRWIAALQDAADAGSAPALALARALPWTQLGWFAAAAALGLAWILLRRQIARGDRAERAVREHEASLAALERRTSEDLARRRDAESESERLRAFLDSIVENLPHMVFVKRADDLRFVRFNRAGEELLGFAREELLGKNDYDFFPKEEADFFTAKDRQVLESLERVDVPEEPIRTRSGATRILHTKKVPIVNGGGRPEYLLGISEDITERKAIEQRLEALHERLRRRTAELEDSNQELEAFAYSVSHDLRAPLRHVLGFTDLLRRNAGEALDPRSQHYLEKIEGSARRMGQLIDDLLAFSRMGRAEMRNAPVALSRVVEEVIAEVREQNRDRAIEWKVAPLPVVTGDPAMLRVVFDNLIANAVKYTRPRPVAHIEIGAETRPDAVVVFVRDDGVGFETQYRHKLFGVFQRLHRPEEFEGSGVGLANVRRIVHRHGGSTWAEGETGHGACFYVSLPAYGKAA
jgi:PAS domain S-box-containing protein